MASVVGVVSVASVVGVVGVASVVTTVTTQSCAPQCQSWLQDAHDWPVTHQYVAHLVGGAGQRARPAPCFSIAIS